MCEKNKMRRLTIGEELQIQNRREYVKAWLWDIGIIVITFASGIATGYYWGFHSHRL